MGPMKIFVVFHQKFLSLDRFGQLLCMSLPSNCPTSTPNFTSQLHNSAAKSLRAYDTKTSFFADMRKEKKVFRLKYRKSKKNVNSQFCTIYGAQSKYAIDFKFLLYSIVQHSHYLTET
jgi:hypothetical protein